MVTPEILEYIRGQYMAGAAKSDIITALTQSGWALADAQEAMAQVAAAPTAASTTPTSPTATPSTTAAAVGEVPIKSEASVGAQPATVPPAEMPMTKYTAEPVLPGTSAAAFTPAQYQAPTSLAGSGGHALKLIGSILLGLILILIVDAGASYYYGILTFPVTAPFTLPFDIPGVLVSPASEAIPVTAATTTPHTAASIATTTAPMASTTASSTLPLIAPATTTATTTGTKATSTPPKK